MYTSRDLGVSSALVYTASWLAAITLPSAGKCMMIWWWAPSLRLNLSNCLRDTIKCTRDMIRSQQRFPWFGGRHWSNYILLLLLCFTFTGLPSAYDGEGSQFGSGFWSKRFSVACCPDTDAGTWLAKCAEHWIGETPGSGIHAIAILCNVPSEPYGTKNVKH